MNHLFPNTHFYDLNDFLNNYNQCLNKKSSFLRLYVDLWYNNREKLKQDPLYNKVNNLVMNTQYLVGKFEKNKK